VTRDEIVHFIENNSGRKLKLIEAGNSDPQLISVVQIDDEGFSYVLTDAISYAPAGTNGWTQFEDVVDLQVADASN
jgi:hypothetical protein